MFKSFSNNEKLFLLHDLIFIIPLSIVGIFVNFFIWDRTDSLASVGLFQAFSAIGILIGAFFSAVLLNRISPNIMRVVGSILTAFALSLIAIFSFNIIKFLLPAGFAFGFALGLRTQAYKLLFLRVVSVQSREKFITNDKLVSSICAIVVPLAAALMVSRSGNYTILFILMSVFFALSSIPLLLIRGLNVVPSKFALIKAVSEVKAEPDLKKLTFVKFFEGVHIGINNSVWSIIVLYIVGSLQGWGIFNTIFAVISAIITYTLGRKIKFSNSKFFFVIMAFVFTLVGLLFASSFDFVSYLIFSFVAGIASNLFDTAFQSIESKIKDRNIEDSETIDEFNLIEEIPLFLGRMIPFLFVVVFNPTFEDDLLLRIFIVVVSAIPLVISSILSNTYVTKRSEDPFVRG